MQHRTSSKRTEVRYDLVLIGGMSTVYGKRLLIRRHCLSSQDYQKMMNDAAIVMNFACKR
jgi:hypothetical protein